MTDATVDPATSAAGARAEADHRQTLLDALGTVVCIGLALVTIGFAGFRFLGPALPTGASRNADRTFFTSVNAVTGTGFEQSFASVRDFPTVGRLLLAMLAVGGASVTLAGSLYFLRAIFARSLPARTTWIAIAIFALAPAILGAIVSGYDGVYAATGLGLGSQYGALSAGARTWLVALAVPAVLGPAVWLAWRSRDSVLCSTVIAAAVWYVGSTVLLALMLNGLPGGASVGSAVNRAAIGLNEASVLSVNASSGVGVQAAWPREARAGAGSWAVLILMTIGSVPGGVGAGIGLLSIVLLARQARFSLAGRLDGRTARLAAVGLASIAAWLAIVVVAMLILAATQPAVPGDRLLFIVVAAASNVGLSHDPISLTGGGLFVLAVTMLLGRLLPLATLCAMAIVAARATTNDRSSDLS